MEQGEKPWVLSYKDNEIKNMKIGLAIAHSAGFKSPNTDSDDYLIDLSASFTPNTADTYAASFAYKNVVGDTPTEGKWLPGAQYFPDNASIYPASPAVLNPNSYNIVTGL